VSGPEGGHAGAGHTAGAAGEVLEYRVRPAAGAPAGALVLLHGRGSDMDDLVPLLDALDPDRRLAGVTLQAPLRLEPGGHHWYVLGGLGTPEPGSFLASYVLARVWLDERLPDVTGVSLARTAVGGFSQGAVMSYALALGQGRPSPAALLAFSGFIPAAPGFHLDLPAHRDVPAAIGHGIHDPVIPVRFGREAAARLDDAGLRVTYRESPMFHAIDPAFVGTLSRWLPGIVEERRAA
jgi:phospholipase/carboxylesterase